MREIWLLPNRRIFALGMVFPGVVTLLGLLLIWQKWGWIWGLALSVAGLSFAVLIAWQMSVPRLAYRGGELLSVFAIRAAAAIALGVCGMLFSFQWGGANHNRARRSAGAKPGVTDRRTSNRLSKLRREDDLRNLGRWIH